MYISELYINQLTESAWKRRLAQGKLGKDSLRKIQKSGGVDKLHVRSLLNKNKISPTQAKQLLSRKGSIVKSYRDWITGVNQGTENILKRYSAKHQQMPSTSFSKSISMSGDIAQSGVKTGEKMKNLFGAHSFIDPHTGKSVLHNVDKSKIGKGDRGIASIMNRHEADEIRYAKQMMKKHGIITPTSVAGAQAGGAHMTDKVLKNERELERTATRLYGSKATTSKGGMASVANIFDKNAYEKGKKIRSISKYRQKTGEYDIVDKMTAKEIKQTELEGISAIKNQTNMLKTLPPDQRLAHIAPYKEILPAKQFKRLLRSLKL